MDRRLFLQRGLLRHQAPLPALRAPSGAGISGTSGGGNIYTVVVGHGISARVENGQYNQYSMLAAIEARLGLTKLGAAANATPMPLS